MTLLTPTEKRKVRASMTNYMLRCEHSRAQIHYSQARPYHCLGVSPEHGFTADCSSYATAVYAWAGEYTDTPVLDPNGRSYDGYGFTGTLLDENRYHPVPSSHRYLVGDLAIYGPYIWRTKHVVICRTSGYGADAIWSSHGSEAGPVPVRVGYRGDLLIVVRPKSLL